MRQDNRKVSEPLLEALSRYIIPAIYKEVVPSDSEIENISATQALSLANACLNDDDQACMSMAMAWYRLGISVDRICSQGVTAAAAHLGQWWLEDRISFVEVTLASERLQDLVRNAPHLFGDEAQHPDAVCELVVLLGKPVVCQHTLGLLVVEQVFKRRGWRVLKSEQACADTLEILRHTSVDLLGLSVAHSDHVVPTQAFIARCKTESQNPHILIMVGGPQAFLQADLAQTLGADFSATDACEGEALASAKIAALRRSQASNQAVFG